MAKKPSNKEQPKETAPEPVKSSEQSKSETYKVIGVTHQKPFEVRVLELNRDDNSLVNVLEVKAEEEFMAAVERFKILSIQRKLFVRD
jgi:hypothetical protein